MITDKIIFKIPGGKKLIKFQVEERVLESLFSGAQHYWDRNESAEILPNISQIGTA